MERAYGRFGWRTGAILVAVTLAVGGWGAHSVAADLGSADQARRVGVATRTDTRAAKAARASTMRTLAELDATLATRTASRDQIALALYSVTAQLNEAHRSLADETSSLETVDARIGVLRTCLQGVSGALNALSVSDSGTALNRLRAVGTACDAASVAS